MADLRPVYILNKKVEEVARERSEWIESVITENIPGWKIWLVKRFPFLKNFLQIKVEIINEELIADFGMRVWIKLNGEVIGQRKFL